MGEVISALNLYMPIDCCSKMVFLLYAYTEKLSELLRYGSGVKCAPLSYDIHAALGAMYCHTPYIKTFGSSFATSSPQTKGSMLIYDHPAPPLNERFTPPVSPSY